MDELVFVENYRKFAKKLKIELEKLFFPKEIIAVKLHMGEPENRNHLKPEFVAKIVKVLKSLGAKPFLFDSIVKYRSMRNSIEGYKKIARKNGFNESRVGCPIVISEDFITSKINGFDFEVCKPLVDADGVLVLTHVKGHICTGIGAAIKNIGMGAVTKKSKIFMHEAGMPKYVGGCTLCKLCAKNCPRGAIKYSSRRPVFDYEKCVGCSICFYTCKANAIKPRIDNFDRMLAISAKAALNLFKKTYFVNVLKDIARLCDCHRKTTEKVVPDIGIIMGKDIVAIDKASHDKIVKVVRKDIFGELHNKSPLIHIREAEKVGLGDSEYVFKTEAG